MTTKQNETTKSGLIEMRIIKNNGEVMIYIKACPEFEEFLKKTRKIESVENFCLLGIAKEIYVNKIEVNPHEEDSSSRDLILYPYNTRIQLNKAVLRLKGISEGVTIPLNKLIPKTDLNVLIRNFIKDFVDFYKENLVNYEIGVIITNKNIMF